MCNNITLDAINVGDLFNLSSGGTVTVLQLPVDRYVIVQHNDEFGYIHSVRVDHLRTGNVRNPYLRQLYGVGYMGVGPYNSKENGTNTIVYNKWSNMMYRCYDQEFHIKAPYYKSCYVCVEWHNFQTFAQWYYSQPYVGPGYQLDKDILFRGNTLYSPMTCALIPAAINAAATPGTLQNGELPRGINMRGSKYRVKIGSTQYGTHNTLEEANEVYIREKKLKMIYYAELYQDYIDDRVYHALLDWEVW